MADYPLRQRILNFLQVSFFFFWSCLWQSTSILIRMLFWKGNSGLHMANKVWAPPLVQITGSDVETQGLEKIDLTKPHIFVCNHQSTLDIAVAYVAIPVNLRFIAKKELLYVPFLGWYMWAIGMIFVDRKRHKKAIKSLKRAAEIIQGGANIIAFPEGTRSPDGRIYPLKKGVFIVAIEAGVPIVPVAIEGTRVIMPKNSFRLQSHPIRVAIGDPIPTANLSYEDREKLVELTHQRLVELNLSIGGLGAADVPHSEETAEAH